MSFSTSWISVGDLKKKNYSRLFEEALRLILFLDPSSMSEPYVLPVIPELFGGSIIG